MTRTDSASSRSAVRACEQTESRGNRAAAGRRHAPGETARGANTIHLFEAPCALARGSSPAYARLGPDLDGVCRA